MTELSRDHLCHAFGLYFDLATGAGEEDVMGATAATIANALFDATGVRLRQYPMTVESARAALVASKA